MTFTKEVLEKTCKEIFEEVDVATITVGAFLSKIEKKLETKFDVQQKKDMKIEISKMINDYSDKKVIKKKSSEKKESTKKTTSTKKEPPLKTKPKTKKEEEKDSKKEITKKRGASKAAVTEKKRAPKELSEKKPRKPGPPLLISNELNAIINVNECPRTEVIKRVWDYIKSNNCQDQQNKKYIVADSKLKVLFDGEDRVNMMHIAKYISKHLTRKN